ncbi:hypothetical protein AGOR_G00209480 [Albula goreensis]|uniref:Uncharacterized protein n=1 Tax=Albula goreensis TaxID=1534307 RepID=A0A8T3CRW7_9TELE|nr:hypothetical protein AGOR_G00209480 [Albula goreensis]
MSASASNGFVIVTQVYPQQSDTAAPPLYTAPNVSSVLGKFLKGEPKALGTVQILISVMVFLFGIVMVIYWDSIAAVSGIAFWGAIIYMVSGALTVAADNKLNKCLSRSHGITGVLLVFSILEFIVSICVSAFACKAVCHSTPEVRPTGGGPFRVALWSSELHHTAELIA